MIKITDEINTFKLLVKSTNKNIAKGDKIGHRYLNYNLSVK